MAAPIRTFKFDDAHQPVMAFETSSLCKKWKAMEEDVPKQLFSASDIFGAIIPGGLLVIGVVWMFCGYEELSSYKDLNLGLFGLITLLSLVIGQCMSLAGLGLFSLINITRPEWVFIFDLEGRLTPPQFSALRHALRDNFEIPESPSLRGRFLPALWEINVILTDEGRTGYLSHLWKRCAMVTGLFVAAAVTAIIALILGIFEKDAHVIWRAVAAGLASGAVALTLFFQAKFYAEAIAVEAALQFLHSGAVQRVTSPSGAAVAEKQTASIL